MMQFDVLRKRRRKLDLTQQEIADTCHIRQSYVSQIERGEITNPDYEILSSIAKALGLRFTDVLPEEAR